MPMNPRQSTIARTLTPKTNRKSSLRVSSTSCGLFTDSWKCSLPWKRAVDILLGWGSWPPSRCCLSWRTWRRPWTGKTAIVLRVGMSSLLIYKKWSTTSRSSQTTGTAMIAIGCSWKNGARSSRRTRNWPLLLTATWPAPSRCRSWPLATPSRSASWSGMSSRS